MQYTIITEVLIKNEQGEMMDAKTFGEKIKEARINRGLTQQELGILVGGVKRNTVCQWEKGGATPRGETLFQLLKVLKLKLA